MNQVVDTLTLFLLKEKVIEENEKEIFHFGIKRLLSNSIDLLVILFAAISLGKVSETVLLCIGFIPLRRLLGGYHKNTAIGCKSLTYLLYLMVMLTGNYVDYMLTKPLYFGIFILCGTCIGIIGPIDHKYFRWSAGRKHKNLKLSLIFMCLVSLCVLIVDQYFHQQLYIMFYLIMGVMIASQSVVFAGIKERRD